LSMLIAPACRQSSLSVEACHIVRRHPWKKGFVISN
jgi:hypothetical protein